MRYWTVLAGAVCVTAVGTWAAPAKKTVKPAPKKPSPKAPAKPAAAKPAPKAPQEVRLGNVSGKLPGEWLSVNPDGQFRAGQYAIPKAAGDAAQAHLIVFHFGAGGGGGVEDNVRRWIGMVRQPDGSDSSGAMKRDLIEREGLRLTTVDLPGTYLERPFPMSQEFAERPNYRMLAAIIETTKEGSDGPYYVRLVGPAKTVTAAKPGWDAFIASLKWD